MAKHETNSTNTHPRGSVPRGNTSRAFSAPRKRAGVVLTEKQSNSRNKTIRILLACVLVVVAFLAGFGLRNNVTLMTQLGVISSTNENDVNPGSTVTGSTYDSISARIAEIEGIILNYSMNEYNLDTATSQLISSLINTTNDKYLRYYSPERYSALVYESSSENNYAGIGVLFGEYNGSAYVVDVFENSVAQNSGVQEGDFVVAINGDRSQNWTVTEVSNALANKTGTSVAITWRRPTALAAAGGTEFTTSLICKKYTEQNVSTQLNGTVGYIDIKQLGNNATDLIKDAISTLQTQGAKSFVLDLRDVPGGYFTQACDIVDLFISSGIICQVQTKDGVSNKTATAQTYCDSPLVVLINKNTSGSAEVIASALKDNGRAKLIGETTMGKGSVQVIRELSFGGAFRYTAAYYRTSQGHDIEGVGISPDITIGTEESQLKVAIETAQSL